MSNILTAILPKILATGFMGLRSRVMMTRLVNLDYSTEAAKKGSTIDVPISQTQTASDVVPAQVPSAPSDITPETVQIQMNNWKKTNFHLTDDELGKIMGKEHFIPLQMGEAFEALAVAINQSVFAEYPGVYGYTGTAGTTPFSDVTDATEARRILNLQKCPKATRRAVLDWDAEAAALVLAQFSDAEKVGSSNVKIEGEIGRKFGIDWNADDDVPTHTAGTITGALTIKTGTVEPVGETSIVVTTNTVGSCALLEGDIISIAGDTQTYVVTADVAITAASTDGTIVIQPPLKVATTGDEAVTVKADHVVNMAFHRDAFALAMRAPDAALKEVMKIENSFTMGDPVSGLVVRLELLRQYKQVVWELDCMWGTKLVRPPLATRIAG